MRHSLGDMVKIRDDLLFGKEYCQSDKIVGVMLSYDHLKFLGGYGAITEINSLFYKLNFSNDLLFTDEMFDHSYVDDDDEISDDYIDEYKTNTDELIEHVKKDMYPKLIDYALDNNDIEAFNKYSKLI